VTETLPSLWLSVQQEVVVEEGHSLDLLVDCGGEQPIPIEVDGPERFVGRVPTGSTLLNRRQLQHLGCISCRYITGSGLG